MNIDRHDDAARIREWLRAPDGLTPVDLARLERRLDQPSRSVLAGPRPLPALVGVAAAAMAIVAIVVVAAVSTAPSGGRQPLGAAAASDAATPSAGTPAPSAGTPAMSPASATPSPGPAIVWDSGSVRLEADSYELRFDGQRATGHGTVRIEGGAHTPSERDFGVTWEEGGVEQRLRLHLRTNGRFWWVGQLWAYDGREGGDWIEFHSELREKLFRTPVGEPLERDVTMETTIDPGASNGPVPATLTITGLRLTAFEPGRGAAAMRGCREPTRDIEEREVAHLSPAQVEAMLQRMGVCYEFRLGSSRGTERWCIAPPGGEFEGIDRNRYKRKKHKPDRYVVFYIGEAPDATAPPAGWGCPTDGPDD